MERPAGDAELPGRVASSEPSRGFAGISWQFTGSWPAGMFPLVPVLQRWMLHGAACPGLLTHICPPLRRDPGCHEPATTGR